MIALNSNLCVFLIVLTHVSVWVPMGLSLTALNPTELVLRSFVNQSYMIRYNTTATDEFMSLIVILGQSLLIVGSAIGAISVRFWVNRFSRRGVMTIVHVASLVSAILMSIVAYFANSYETLILGRFINGLARGVGFNVGPLYVAEICNRKTLAFYQSSVGWVLLVSGALGNGLGHPSVLGGPNTWPLVLGLPGLLSLLYLLCLPWIPNTLTWLLKTEALEQNQNNNQSSIQLLTRLRCGSSEVIADEYQRLKNEVDLDLHVEKASIKQIVSIGKYRRQLIAAVFLQFSFQAAGEQVVLQYTNVLLEKTGTNPEHSTFYTIGILVLMSAVTIIAMPLLGRFGGRKMLIFGLSLSSVGIFLLIISSITSKSISNMSYVGTAAMVILIIGIATGPLLTLAALPSEVTSQIVRPNALWLSGTVFWISGAAIAFIVPYSIESWGGYAYIPFFVSVILEITFVVFFIPETFHKTACEIQEYFETGRRFRRKESTVKITTCYQNAHAENAAAETKT